jgi:KipI family sensor histidine kinase inhibitor
LEIEQTVTIDSDYNDGVGSSVGTSFFIGDGCLCWPLGDGIDLAVSRKVHQLYRTLKADPHMEGLSVTDVVPAYNAVAVYFDPAVADIPGIRRRVDAVAGQSGNLDAPEGVETYRIPVVYDGEDLDRVARHSGLSVEGMILLHAGGDYTVAMIGFQPHFPYLIGLDDRLITPRLESPRTRIPAGTVAIGGAQTGIYPQESPGGWNLIGRTRPELLTVLKPGDRVRFEAVDRID